MRPLLLLLLSFLSCHAAVALPQAGAGGEEWLLVQKAQDTGNHEVYLSRDAVKIVCKTLGFQIVSRAPDWPIYVFRPETKQLWVGKLDQFNGTIVINPFALPRLNSANLSTKKPATYLGFKCTRFSNENNRPIVLATDQLGASARACEFLCRYYSIPKLDCVPLYRLIKASGLGRELHKDRGWLDAEVTQDLRTGDRVALATTSCKKIPYNDADFQYPQGYHRDKEINHVTFSPDRKDALNDMLDNIGFTPSGKKKAASSDQDHK